MEKTMPNFSDRTKPWWMSRVRVALHVLRGQPVAWRINVDGLGRIGRRVPGDHLLVDSCRFEAPVRMDRPGWEAIMLLADAIDELALRASRECGENDDVLRKVEAARELVRGLEDERPAPPVDIRVRSR